MKKKNSKKMVQIGKGMKVTRKKEREMEKKAGSSNVGKYPNVKPSEFAGPKGGASAGSFPIDTEKRAKAALSYARNAPNPEGIKKAVYKKYPALAKRSKNPVAKKLVSKKGISNGKRSKKK